MSFEGDDMGLYYLPYVTLLGVESIPSLLLVPSCKPKEHHFVVRCIVTSNMSYLNNIY